MFDRFTDRARKVMALASQEAQRLNHEYIGTEHMLLGLVLEGSGVGANVLKNLGVELRRVRREVETLVRKEPEQVMEGKLPQTPRAKRVIEHAIAEAQRLHHNCVGTEHLLLGLLCETEGVAAQVLMNLGLNMVAVRAEVINLLGGGQAPQPPQSAPSPPVGVPDELAGVPEQFRDHPLVQHYGAIIAALTDEKCHCAANGDYEWAAELRDELEALRPQLNKLVGWLRTDPNFGRGRDW